MAFDTLSDSGNPPGPASHHHEAPQEDLQVLLSNLHKNQSVVLEGVSEINWRVEDATDTFDLDKESLKARSYLQKLQAIRQNMVLTKNKLVQLEERALKVRQQKEKEHADAYKSWMIDMEYQKKLVAKYEPPPTRRPPKEK